MELLECWRQESTMVNVSSLVHTVHFLLQFFGNKKIRWYLEKKIMKSTQIRIKAEKCGKFPWRLEYSSRLEHLLSNLKTFGSGVKRGFAQPWKPEERFSPSQIQTLLIQFCLEERETSQMDLRIFRHIAKVKLIMRCYQNHCLDSSTIIHNPYIIWYTIIYYNIIL